MSCLDLAFASPALARVGEWDVLDKRSMGSDHFPIVSIFGRSLILDPGIQVKRFNFVRAKWNEFQVGVAESVNEINSDGCIDEHNDSLTKMILKVALKTIPCRGAPKERVIVPLVALWGQTPQSKRFGLEFIKCQEKWSDQICQS